MLHIVFAWIIIIFGNFRDVHAEDREQTEHKADVEEQEQQKKRKAEDDVEDSDHLEKLKKSRQSCVIVYERKPQATLMTPVLDLTVEATSPTPAPPQEITLDESQEFSLRYDQDVSPIIKDDRGKTIWFQ